MKGSKDEFRWRVRLIAFGFLLFSGVLIARLYSLQIVNAEAFRERADRQYTNPDQKIFDRGSIYFTTKDGEKFSAAALQTGYTLAINPGLITDEEGTYDKLNAIYPLDREIFMKKADKKEDPYEEIGKRITKEAGAELEALNLPGVRLFTERWRTYPGNTLASHALGFLGYDGDDFGGRYGLERQFEDILGRGTKNVYSNFFAEVFSNINKKITYSSGGEGDVVSTIEPNVQLLFERELEGVQEKYNAKLTGGIIINPQNGEIYAMGAVPNFDPNTFQTVDDAAVFTNPNVQNVYEMGSIIKPLTVAAGLDAGVIEPTSTYFDAGSLTLNGRTIYNYDKRARGEVSMQEVLNQSLNTGVSYIATKLGNKRFADYFFALGLDSYSGIDLPHEGRNLAQNLRTREDVNYATASFGQGIAVTPVSLVRALSALGNGGELITPHVVKRIEYTSGTTKTPTYTEKQRVFSAETSRKISSMLTTVVDKALLGGEVVIPGYSIAAKTGTAQIAKPGGGYYDDRYLHSFFGYFPAYDPKFLVFMYTLEPQGEDYASHTLSYPFHTIAQYLINYYEIPPDR
ncbi:MAG TPA: penicillin-binding protein 2 [Candidatus Paceibacterota bacterium]|nr:penicillin-binding protein 2 [Candidatus Paceibacterota bacterium]